MRLGFRLTGVIFLTIAAGLTSGCGTMPDSCYCDSLANPIEPTPPEDFTVVGYLMDGNLAKIDPETIGYLTDLIYFSIEPNEDGSLRTDRFDPAHVEALNALRDTFGMRVMVCVGGWGRSEGFAAMATDDARRARFVDVLLQFCLDNGFEGVDYDWEFPENDAEMAAYGRLLNDTKKAFKRHGLLVTIALGHHQRLSPKALRAVDRVHLMTYDMGHRHAPLEAAQRAADRRIHEDGVKRNRISLGLPFYARLMEDTQQARSYAAIVEEFQPGPGVDEIGGWYFNGPGMMRQKVEWATTRGLAGVMIWEVSQDAPGDASLLRAIHEAVWDTP